VQLQGAFHLRRPQQQDGIFRPVPAGMVGLNLASHLFQHGSKTSSLLSTTAYGTSRCRSLWHGARGVSSWPFHRTPALVAFRQRPRSRGPGSQARGGHKGTPPRVAEGRRPHRGQPGTRSRCGKAVLRTRLPPATDISPLHAGRRSNLRVLDGRQVVPLCRQSRRDSPSVLWLRRRARVLLQMLCYVQSSLHRIYICVMNVEFQKFGFTGEQLTFMCETGNEQSLHLTG
jgi:hypothetical protein